MGGSLGKPAVEFGFWDQHMSGKPGGDSLFGSEIWFKLLKIDRLCAPQLTALGTFKSFLATHLCSFGKRRLAALKAELLRNRARASILIVRFLR